VAVGPNRLLGRFLWALQRRALLPVTNLRVKAVQVHGGDAAYMPCDACLTWRCGGWDQVQAVQLALHRVQDVPTRRVRTFVPTIPSWSFVTIPVENFIVEARWSRDGLLDPPMVMWVEAKLVVAVVDKAKGRAADTGLADMVHDTVDMGASKEITQALRDSGDEFGPRSLLQVEAEHSNVTSPCDRYEDLSLSSSHGRNPS